MAPTICPLCHGKGGSYVPTLDGGRRWVKCSQCKRTQSRSAARQQALDRYIHGNRNPHAKAHCLKLGFTEQDLITMSEVYDNERQRLL